MTSWFLFRYFNVLAESPIDRHPLFTRALDNPPAWYGVVRRIAAKAGPWLVAATLLWLFIPIGTNSIILYACGPVLLVPSLALWALPLGLALGPALAHERERRTWELLRVTPNDTATLVLIKARGALWWLREALFVLRLVLVAASFPVGAGLMYAVTHTPNPRTGPPLCLATQLIVAAICALLYLMDRAQQLTLMMLAALGASAFSRSTRTAIPAATAAAGAAWLADALLALVISAPAAALWGRIDSPNIPALIVLGPLVSFVIELAARGAFVAFGLTLILREIAIWALWRGIVRAAHSE